MFILLLLGFLSGTGIAFIISSTTKKKDRPKSIKENFFIFGIILSIVFIPALIITMSIWFSAIGEANYYNKIYDLNYSYEDWFYNSGAIKKEIRKKDLTSFPW